MLKLYAVEVRRAGEFPDRETIQVRTYSARRAELLVLETFPGCTARAHGVFTAGVWELTTPVIEAGHRDDLGTQASDHSLHGHALT